MSSYSEISPDQATYLRLAAAGGLQSGATALAPKARAGLLGAATAGDTQNQASPPQRGNKLPAKPAQGYGEPQFGRFSVQAALEADVEGVAQGPEGAEGTGEAPRMHMRAAIESAGTVPPALLNALTQEVAKALARQRAPDGEALHVALSKYGASPGIATAVRVGQWVTVKSAGDTTLIGRIIAQLANDPKMLREAAGMGQGTETLPLYGAENATPRLEGGSVAEQGRTADDPMTNIAMAADAMSIGYESWFPAAHGTAVPGAYAALTWSQPSAPSELTSGLVVAFANAVGSTEITGGSHLLAGKPHYSVRWSAPGVPEGIPVLWGRVVPPESAEGATLSVLSGTDNTVKLRKVVWGTGAWPYTPQAKVFLITRALNLLRNAAHSDALSGLQAAAAHRVMRTREQDMRAVPGSMTKISHDS